MKMSTGTKLTPEERRDLDKFAKFLALKSAVIIVESRLGAKVYTKCNPASNKDVWVSVKLGEPYLSVKIICTNENSFIFINRYTSMWYNDIS